MNKLLSELVMEEKMRQFQPMLVVSLSFVVFSFVGFVVSVLGCYSFLDSRIRICRRRRHCRHCCRCCH